MKNKTPRKARVCAMQHSGYCGHPNPEKKILERELRRSCFTETVGPPPYHDKKHWEWLCPDHWLMCEFGLVRGTGKYMWYEPIGCAVARNAARRKKRSKKPRA